MLMKQASCWTEMTYQDCRDVVAPHWSVLLVIGHSVRPAEPLTRHTCCTASAPWQTSRHLLHTQRVRIRADDDHAVDDLIADRQLHAIGARPRCSAPPRPPPACGAIGGAASGSAAAAPAPRPAPPAPPVPPRPAPRPPPPAPGVANDSG